MFNNRKSERGNPVTSKRVKVIGVGIVRFSKPCTQDPYEEKES
jgi:hypothetical protein